MTFEEVYQQIRKMHYEILDILTEYRDEWCDDCKRFNTVIRETLNREPSEDGTLEVKIAERNQWREDVEAIKSVPSADRPKGKWIYWREDGIKRCKCSRCLTSYGCLDTPYCPNCGEKMVEGRSEE